MSNPVIESVAPVVGFIFCRTCAVCGTDITSRRLNSKICASKSCRYKRYAAKVKSWLLAHDTPERKKKIAQKQYEYDSGNLALYLWRSCKYHSKRKGLEFSIEQSDIVVPDVCPVLGIPIFKVFEPSKNGAHSRPNSPSVDRVDSLLGYVKGNVVVISMRQIS